MPETITTEELDVLRAKADAFDRLVRDLATLLPLEARIKKLAGLPLLEALEGYELKLVRKPVPSADYLDAMTPLTGA